MGKMVGQENNTLAVRGDEEIIVDVLGTRCEICMELDAALGAAD